MKGGKQKIKEQIRKFKQVRTWQLCLILLPLVFLTATLLRFDHLRMVSLKDDVMSADEAGDEEAIRQNIEKLQDFVRSHIVINSYEENGQMMVVFGTGTFYLEQSYLRAANQAIEEAAAQPADDSNPNGNIYAAASAVCQPQAIANGWSWNSQEHLDCWMGELNKYSESEINASVSANIPSTELYRLNFASPVWAFSWAGIFILLCALLMIVILIRLIIWLVLHISLLFVK